MILAAALDNINNANGFSIALTGILIVFTALTLICAFLTNLPRMLVILNQYFPVNESHAAPAARPQSAAADDELVAAIGLAFHVHQSGQN